VIELPAPAFVPVFEFIKTNPIVTVELAPALTNGNESPISEATKEKVTIDFLRNGFIKTPSSFAD
jgi:hypothetical protein